MTRHKKDWGPGYRFFKCDNGHEWKDKSRDWTSPSTVSCPIENCFEFGDYLGGEPHYEWPTDKFGNLLEEKNE